MKVEKDKNKDRTSKRETGATNSPERSGKGESTNKRGDAGELPLDPEEQSKTWNEKEDSSLDSNPEKDKAKGANWAKKDAHPGRNSGKPDESGEDEDGWNAKDFGEGRGHRQPNTLDQQVDKLKKGKDKK